MTPAAPAQQTAAARRPWALVFLLVLGMCVSFFDRGNLAIAAPVLGPALGLSAMQKGLLLSAFFWTYSVLLVPAGWLADRFQVKWLYAGGFLLWSLATLGTAAMSTFAGLLAMRLLLGVGETVVYPCNGKILVNAFPEERRGLANALTDLGSRLGPMMGNLLGGLMVAGIGWRGLFTATGAGALLWLIPWLLWAPRIDLRPAKDAGSNDGWVDLLRRRDVWGTFLGLCGANYAWYFLLSWMPSYLADERHFTMKSVAIWGALPYLVMAIAQVNGGVMADRWIRAGHAPVAVRRGIMVTGLLLTSVLLPLALLPRIEWAFLGIFLAFCAFGTYVSNLWALTQTLAGSGAVGRWTGMQNAFGNLAGIISPIVTGWLVSKTGNFQVAFVAAAAACVVGAAGFGLLIKAPPRS
jgi:MFS transporter, ACS family, D-galactonate transporter